MFSEMRRKNQALRSAEREEILSICTHGVLALDGDDGYPYALPISYAYADGHMSGKESRELMEARKKSAK